MLKAPLRQTLHRALLSSFEPTELESLVRTNIGVPIERLVTPGSVGTIVFDLINAAERAGWTTDLVKAAYTAKPQSKELAEVYAALGLATPVNLQIEGFEAKQTVRSTDLALERVIADSPRLVSLDGWQIGLQNTQAQTCRIEVGGNFRATGFLVGPDLVLTCHYVVADLLVGQESESVRVRFDYGVVGKSISEGTIVPLHKKDWLVDASPPAASEFGADADAILPTEDELDHALLRLARPVGQEVVPATSRRRGWISFDDAVEVIEPGMFLMIAQYPLGGELKLQLDNHGITGVNANSTRVTYRTRTEPGSGGGPCFSADWKLVAMHHARGVHDDDQGVGIPAFMIRDRLRRLGRITAVSARGALSANERLLSPAVTKPPEPEPVRNANDPQKGRWGGAATRDGLQLSVQLVEVAKNTFIFNAIVETTDGTELDPPVVFHLHDSYPKSVIWIRRIREGRRAILEGVSSYGVFTIGAQARSGAGQWVGLELDLLGLPDLPKRFLNR